ncbi:MAG: sugar ABC transporter permease [Betaproteobacteria bacterium TMED41]|nr:MAG: sugar ABC transporter permease [Betaproteobacteria bacterium TMED41]
MSNYKILFGKYGGLFALTILIVFNLFYTPYFATLQALSINLTQVAPIILVGLGMTFVIATKGIDLSVGALMSIAGTLSAMILLKSLLPVDHLYLRIILAIVVPILITTGFGCFNGWLINKFSIQPIIATLVLFIAGRGIAQVLTDGDVQFFEVPEFQKIALSRILIFPFQIYYVALLAFVSFFVLNRTVLGKQILAVGGNEKASNLTGIPTKRIRLFVYGFSGFCCSIAGLNSIAMNSAADAMWMGYLIELDAIAAVVIGGTLLSGGKATIIGTILGAFIIQLVGYTLIGNGVPDAVVLISKGLLIIISVWLQKNN